MRLRTKLAALAVTAGVALTATAAFAAWNAHGDGSGSASAYNKQALKTISVTADEALYPGKTTDATLKVNNPNPYAVDVLVTGGVIDSSDNDCDLSTGVSFDPPTTALHVEPGDNQFTLDDAISMDNTSDDACSGATFSFDVDLDGASVVVTP